MLTRYVWRLAACCFVTSTGCDLLESATATTIVGGIIISTPAVSIDGQLDIPAEVAATAYVGERQSATSTEPPTPIGTADVSVSFGTSMVTLPVREAQNGVYLETSLTEDSLSYVGGEDYTLVADINGSRFGGTVTAPPVLTAAGLTLTPNPTPSTEVPTAFVHQANTDLTIAWGSMFGRYAYATVLRADPTDPSNPQQVFDNRPDTTNELLQLILGTPPTSITIPAETFAQDGLYGVLLVAMDNTDDLLPDTFLGSPILAGSGVAVLLTVAQP